MAILATNKPNTLTTVSIIALELGIITIFCKDTPILPIMPRQMLSHDNICRGVEPCCVGVEEVAVEGLADVEEQLAVERGLVEDALHRAGGDVDLPGEPLVGVTLAAQLVAD